MQHTTDDETVYTVYTGGGTHADRVYHTSRDCPRLAQATSVKEVPTDSLWDETAECDWCRNQRDR